MLLLHQNFLGFLEFRFDGTHRVFQGLEIIPGKHIQGRIKLLLKVSAETEFFSFKVTKFREVQTILYHVCLGRRTLRHFLCLLNQAQTSFREHFLALGHFLDLC